MRHTLQTFSLAAILSLFYQYGTADDYPVYVVTVDNLRQISPDQQNCNGSYHAMQNIMLESHRFAVEYANTHLMNGTGLQLRTLVIDACYSADISEQQVDCIFLRSVPFGIVPKGMCQARNLIDTNRTTCGGGNIPNGQLVAVMGPLSSNTAEQYALFMQKVGTIVTTTAIYHFF